MSLQLDTFGPREIETERKRKTESNFFIINRKHGKRANGKYNCCLHLFKNVPEETKEKEGECVLDGEWLSLSKLCHALTQPSFV